jgi:DNA polymerase I
LKRTVLLDGDTVVFAAASACEEPIEWSDWLWTLHANLDEAKQRLDRAIERIMEELNGDHLVVALSCDQHTRWRPQVMPEYKANRTKGRKPVVYEPLRKYVLEQYDTYLRPTLEGDDVLGILATNPKLYAGTEKIIAAIDKDMRTIPGLLYNYDKQTLEDISLDEADHFFFMQILMGDPTDGYKGCPGIGPKKAEKILADSERAEWWPAVVRTYEAAGLSEDVALMNARVARICRAEDYDFAKKEVILWTP